MGLTGDAVGDVVWPIVDDETSGPIDGRPRPDQMLCWCPSVEKQSQVRRYLNAHADLLAACKALIDADHHDHFAARMSDSEMEAIEKIKAAVAKAEGEPK